MKIRASLLLLAMFQADPVFAESWLRVEHPNEALLANLPPGAIDYGAFVWMSSAGAPVALLGPEVTAVERPFDLIIDGKCIDPAAPAIPSDPWLQPVGNSAADFRLVQLFGPPRESDLAQMRAANVRPVRYLPPFTYVVHATQANLDALSARSPMVRWAGKQLAAQRVPLQSRGFDAGPTRAMALVDAASADAVIARLIGPRGYLIERTPLTPDLTLVELELPGDHYLEAAGTPGVFALQHIQGGGGPRSEMTNQSIVGGYTEGNVIVPGYQGWLAPTGLTGAGVRVSIVDGGFRSSHMDLAANVVPCTGTEGSCLTSNDSHGTHVAGAVAGRGISGVVDSFGFLRGQGVAPGASLIQQRYFPFLGAGPGSMVANGMLRIFKDAAVSGARIANNSWGPTGTPQGYDIPTMQVDMIARDADPVAPGSQPILAVWSIMNGNGDRDIGICQPSSLGSPDEAKNLFAVGSTRMLVGGLQSTAIFDVSSNSAHGPACDGRQVPHIVAPGCSTDGPTGTGNSSFGTMCGTSMAAPVVSGASALYWQRHRSLHGRDPSPAMVKAVFTAAARNLTGHLDADAGVMPQRPNRFAGWGRLDLDAVINPGVDVWLHDQETVLTRSGAEYTVKLRVDDPAQPVRIMLAWTDAPGVGTGGTTPAWVNDLDLTVLLGPHVFRGNVFNAADGISAPGGSADFKNNLEGVFLAPAQHAGADFRLNVLAAVIAADALDPWVPTTPRQDFAVVCYNCRVISPGGPSSVDGVFASGFE